MKRSELKRLVRSIFNEGNEHKPHRNYEIWNVDAMDEETDGTDGYGVFDVDSGYCTFYDYSEAVAEKYAKRLNKQHMDSIKKLDI